jgi:hypothetical protein
VVLRRDRSRTDLLPEPPFTHVAFELNDGTRYARSIAERATVEVQQYAHQSTPVADTSDVFAAHVRDRFLQTTFERSAVPDSQQEILDAITTGGGRYEE